MSFLRRVVLVFFLIGLLVVLLNLRENRPLTSMPQVSQVGRLVGFVLRPFQIILVGSSHWFKGIWNGYINLIDVKQNYVRLQEEDSLKALQILSLKERLKSEESFQIMEQKMEGLKVKGIAGDVVSFDPYSVSQTVWISVGESDGVKIDQPVISVDGLVGRIVKMLSHSSQVLLITDPRFSVDVIDEQTRVRALVVGSGRGAQVNRYPFMTHLEYLKLGDEINSGDLLITSGMGILYPAGLPVGKVIKVEKGSEELFASSAVLPVVDISKLEQVFVIHNPETPSK